MRYIVSGYRRCGTGLMMRLLWETLPDHFIIYEPEKEKMLNEEVDGYKPNPSGLYEISTNSYREPTFLKARLYNKTVLKIFFDGLILLPGFNHVAYTIFFMERDPREINASLKKLKSYHETRDKDDIEVLYNDFPFSVHKPYDQDAIDHVKSIMEVRRDVCFVPIQFKELINSPLKILAEISKHVPLVNMSAAAEIVDPKFYRSRCD